MRPPVTMPLAAMMIAGPRTSLIFRDSSTERVSWKRAVWSGQVPEVTGLAVSGSRSSGCEQ